MRKKTEKDYRALAKSRGFEWIGEFPRSVSTKTRWRCAKNHEWMMRFHNVQQGRGCPYCSGKARKTAGDYANLAKMRGFIWLGPMPENIKTLTSWQCSEGHVFQSSYHSISNSGRGCPICGIQSSADKRRHDDETYHRLGELRGFIWLGPSVQTTHRRTTWQCPNGHIFQKSYNKLLGGQNCPTCQDRVNGQPVSKPQREICDLLGGELNYREAQYSIDVVLFVDGHKIAIEYDCWYWHKDRYDHDLAKTLYLLEQGWKVFRIKTSTQVPDERVLNRHIQYLLNGASWVELMYWDWDE